ncbi:hypothetical protein KSC_103150 [Ktedonobacter sp. SOSP1-52]|uniref:neuraminidase-like domain-containing protein n=1 Tax=Ktedonobacter sp. SOSP1-52 TaxID=2778366 RepID=UPI00191560D3|nr:neuraminidase-like domain-containing protein [Ktedonobacter sp. SOSP1-52]GHO71423.1 hypothetical protein KSC_103150 [Ktedonobacter sp. SOSP1-52]
MKPVISPLKFGDHDTDVANLQDALLLLIDKGRIQLSAAEAQTFKNLLSQEQQAQTYKDGTSKAVALFQQQQHLQQSTGAVDAPTAAALNQMLKDLGALDAEQNGQKPMIAGQVVQDDRAPFRGTVILFYEADQGSIRLGEDSTDPEGRYTISYDSALGLNGTKLRVAAFDSDSKLRVDAKLEAAKPVEIVNLTVPREAPLYRVDGRVASRSRAGVGGLLVQIVDKNVGADVQLTEVSTTDDGSYHAAFSYSGPKQKADLQARVLLGDKFLGASEVRYNASNVETLNVVLPDEADAALASEHETLTGTLSTYFQGNLRDLQETDERQDITYLANKSGWDARPVALAALADQFSARTVPAGGAGLAIPPAFFYALFRAGLPANEDILYHTDAQTLTAIWNKAAEQGVIPLSTTSTIPSAVRQFQALSAQKLLNGPALTGVSSLKDLLVSSRLTDAQQQQFATLYTANRTDPAAFWQAVGTTFGQDTAQRLQLDGKLAFLTINNASLMQVLHRVGGSQGLSDPLLLAQAGYHRAARWSELLTTTTPIPKEIPGDTPEAKRANYADFLAAQVRLSYPTAAVAQMVKSGELPLTGAATGVSDQVHAFLTEHQGKFEIGVQPVEQYIAQNNVQVASEIVQQVKRLQRVYQIAPGDQAMIGLMKRGIDAAYHVVRYDKETFVQSFAADVGGADHAALTYDKSVQIHNTVLNITLSYLNARTAPAIGVHSPPSILDPAPSNADDVIATATLERLFGSMDFCACEHCRSILSPAAYLVDLLLFLHADDQEWNDFCANWRAQHGGAPYPFANQDVWNAAHQPQGTEISPLNVLLSRRPDIEHLPLTCENTNTALPYIDVVNETMEYFIANNQQQLSLNGYLGHDTNDSASEDLLASPQFVIDAAYTILYNERFPLSLPFHQPLENLRRYFNKFEVPLPLAMECLRKTEDLERGANPYGWRDILMEEISLSRAEYEILTDANAAPLWRMYNFLSGTLDADVIAGLSNAEQFARRVGISYEDLVSVLKTRFINPSSDLLPKLERLGVPFATLKALKDGTITDADFDQLLIALAVPPDPAAYVGDPNAPKDNFTPIRTWVKNADNYARIMGLITLALPTGIWAAATVHAIGDCIRPTAAAQVAPTLYFECTTPGVSANSEPQWPTTPGNTCSDGTVAWTCRDTSSGFNFDKLAFRFADPARMTQNISKVEFVRLLRFLRLWKKTGWTMEQTDAMICAFYRVDMAPLAASDIDDVSKLDTGFLMLLPRLGVLTRAMKALNLTMERDLLPLLACWSDIGIRGSTALYRQMFLNAALLKQDPVFADNGYGEFLTDATKKLADHAEALRSAFNQTAEEYDLIVSALDYNANTALTIPNISAIFRRGWLARKLKLSVREFLLLTQLTGLDPFAAPDPTHPAISQLIELVQSMKERAFKSAAALYLIWNQDLSSKSVPDPAQVAAFARMLRLDFAAIETAFAVVDDPDGAIAQARMAMVYGTDAATFFFGLLNDTLTVEVEFSDPDGILLSGTVRQAIENAAGKSDAGIPKIAYDDFRKRLSFSSVLTTGTRDAIKAAAGTGSAAFAAAVDDLYNKNQAVINPFFARYAELRSPYDTYVADTTHMGAEKRSQLLKMILPELVEREKRQQALQAVSAVANTDLARTQTFLDPSTTPFPMHAAGHNDQPALNDFLALETQGLSVQFYASDTAMGATIPAPSNAPQVNYSPLVGGAGNPLPENPTPGTAISGIWRGYLEAPESGFFNLYLEVGAGATVKLALDDKQVSLAQDATFWHNTEPLELRAGALYAFALTVEKVRDIVRMQWEWEPKGQGRAVIPARYLYPLVLFEAFKESYVRFLKVASLTADLGLTSNEMAYFATQADYRINAQGQIDSNGQGWLNALPNSDNIHLANPVDAAIAKNLNAALLTPLRALLDFARIKADISPGDESFLAILKDPVMVTKNTDSLLFTITRWNQTSFNAVLTHLGGNLTGPGQFDLFRRIYAAFALIQKMGISAKALIQATTNEPTGDMVRTLQAALDARYDAASWRDVIRPINDEMRSLQRDALVTYILHQMRSYPESTHIDTPDKLFEYFLMDVQMDPCMQTSRIRHALSSVQLFIERCLMNLEPRVSPAAINAKQWQWMKRYRVWEANRKVYLYPENWLEPELRDDKSPFFKEIESELLQSDITEDSATTTLLNYLSKMEEVAKLEPCGMYYVEPTNKQDEIIHLVARTAGAHRKYYYRRYELGYWMPWEQIKLDIEDNPVIPVVWNDRLLLFWLRLLKKRLDVAITPPRGRRLADLTTNDLPGSPEVTVQAVLYWSEYYNGKWQPAKTSDVARPTTLDTSLLGAFNRAALRLGVAVEGDALRVYIKDTPIQFYRRGQDGLQHLVEIWPGSFLFYNTHSLPIRGEDTVAPVPPAPAPVRRRDLAGDYTQDFAFKYSDVTGTDFMREILQTPIPFEVITPRHALQDSWNAPLFFADSRHAFLVTTQEQSVWMRSYGGYGILDTPGVMQTAQIPPLVVQTTPLPKPRFWGDGAPIESDPGVIDPALMQRFVTEDAYIRQGLSTTRSVTYGDRQIGPSGEIASGSI